MTRRSLVFLATIVLGLSAASIARADNVVVNGGFESGSLLPWFQDRDFSTGTNWAVTSTDAHTGTFSATDVGNKEIRQNFAATPTNSITQISFWLKHPNDSGGIPAFVSFFYSDGTNTGFGVFTVGLGWEFFDVTSNLVAGKNLVGFSVFGYVGGASGNPRTLIDDVVINSTAGQTAVPEPMSLLLLGTGLIGLGKVIRRRK